MMGISGHLLSLHLLIVMLSHPAVIGLFRGCRGNQPLKQLSGSSRLAQQGEHGLNSRKKMSLGKTTNLQLSQLSYKAVVVSSWSCFFLC